MASNLLAMAFNLLFVWFCFVEDSILDVPTQKTHRGSEIGDVSFPGELGVNDAQFTSCAVLCVCFCDRVFGIAQIAQAC